MQVRVRRINILSLFRSIMKAATRCVLDSVIERASYCDLEDANSGRELSNSPCTKRPYNIHNKYGCIFSNFRKMMLAKDNPRRESI